MSCSIPAARLGEHASISLALIRTVTQPVTAILLSLTLQQHFNFRMSLNEAGPLLRFSYTLQEQSCGRAPLDDPTTAIGLVD